MLEPVSKTLVGSQETPYIFEDRLCEEQVVQALKEMHDMPRNEREQLGEKGRQFALANFSYDMYKENWVKTIDEIIENNGSWDTRKNYCPWKKIDF